MTDLLGIGDAGAVRPAATTTDVSNPVAGDTWAQDCTLNTPGTGTGMASKFFNRQIQQLRRVIRWAGIALNNSNDDMLAQAIQSNAFQWTGSFGGTANALTATLGPVPLAINPGFTLRGLIVAINTAAATLAVGGLTALPIVRFDGSALQPGDLTPGLSAFTADGLGNFRLVGTSRIRQAAASTYYVTTSGSDATGTGAVGAPFATPQGAWNYLQKTVDLNGYATTINIAAGTYGQLTASGKLVGQWDQPGMPAITFAGAGAGSVTLTSAQNTVSAINQSLIAISGMTVASTGASTYAVSGQYGGIVQILTGVVFAATTYAHIGAPNFGIVQLVNSYTISGSATAHWYGATIGFIVATPGITITLTGTPAFSVFANAINNSMMEVAGITFSGAASVGTVRYSATFNGVIQTAGGGASYLPGGTAGSATTGQYG